MASALSPCTSLNMSFGFEFDAADLSQFDKIVEQHIQCSPVPRSPFTIPSKDTMQGKFTPRGTMHFSTPQLGSGKRNESDGKWFGPTRERISTPIEDLEHMPRFSFAHSPVFSPVRGSFDDFVNCNASQGRKIRFDYVYSTEYFIQPFFQYK